jgi:2-polyprenyl-3-methyl-5-hydroxy-6-metoxy-1,4-benzoquinol methylase
MNRIKYHIKSYLRRWNKPSVRELDNSALEDYVLTLVKERADSLAPDEALRFLFRMDARLYAIQGQKSVEYGNGVHTKHRHMNYHDFFVKRVKPEEHVLDIGCGIGAVAYDVAEKSKALVVGIDMSAENISIARERFSHPRVSYVLGDALKDLPGERVDVVILSNVLEHLPGRPQFLRRVQQAVHPKRFLIRIPMFERDWRVPLKKELGVEWRLDLTHETEYTLEAFEEEMRDAGLFIVYKEVRWGEIWAEVETNDGKS